jgi:hypothetical protein
MGNEGEVTEVASELEIRVKSYSLAGSMRVLAPGLTGLAAAAAAAARRLRLRAGPRDRRHTVIVTVTE